MPIYAMWGLALVALFIVQIIAVKIIVDRALRSKPTVEEVAVAMAGMSEEQQIEVADRIFDLKADVQ